MVKSIAAASGSPGASGDEAVLRLVVQVLKQAGRPLRSSEIADASCLAGAPLEPLQVEKILYSGAFSRNFVRTGASAWSLAPTGAKGRIVEPIIVAVDSDGQSQERTITVGKSAIRVADHTAFAPTCTLAPREGASSGGGGAEDAPLKPGETLLGGRFAILRELGKGGMGRVYAARDRDVNREVAIKTVNGGRATALGALRNEVALLVRIDRPDYFPRVYEPFEDRDRLFVPMDLIEGENLEAHLSRAVPRDLDASWVVRVFDQVCDRIHYLHHFPAGRVLFRDLKPANIMVQCETTVRDESDCGHIRLVDFGIATVVGAPALDAGTPWFWAPEARSGGSYSTRSDVFALGRVLRCLLLGSGNVAEVGAARVIPSAAERGLPAQLLRTADLLAASDPRERPASVRAAQDLVRDALSGVTRRAMTGPAVAGPASGAAEGQCQSCGARESREFYLCSVCGAPLRPFPAGDDDVPGWSFSVNECASSMRGVSGDKSSVGTPRRRLELIERASVLRRVPAYQELTCLPHVHVEAYAYQTASALRVLGAFGGRAILADEVGLGKTIEAGLVLKEYLVRREARRVLILVPPALRQQWRSELREKFSIGDAVTFGRDDEDDMSDAGVFSRSDVVVIVATTRARIAPLRDLIPTLDWDVVVLDEAHHARPGGRGGNAIGKLVSRIRSKRMLLLTATPAQNNLTELLNLVNLLRPGLLAADQSSFQRRFGGKHRDWRVTDRESLRELLAHVMIRNRRADVHKAFPRRRARTQAVPVSAPHMAAYREIVGALQAIGGVAAGFTLAIRAQQFCTSFRALGKADLPPAVRVVVDRICKDPHFKLQFFVERIVPEMKAEEKVLVFSQFEESQREIHEALVSRGLSALWATGGPADRVRTVARFRSDPSVRFLVSGRSLSEGVNLQFCRCMVNFDLPWNPQQIEQRIGRIQRLGSPHREVLVLNLVARETIEDLVIDYVERKLGMFEQVFGFVEAVLGQLDEDDQGIEGFLREALVRGRSGFTDPDVARLGGERIEAARRAAEDEEKPSLYEDLLDGLGAEDDAA